MSRAPCIITSFVFSLILCLQEGAALAHGEADAVGPPASNLESGSGPGIPAVRLTEFMAANASTIADEDGDSSDWIELQNAGLTLVSLEGWFLTDDPSNPARWRFPVVSLAPGEFYVVWASAKNRVDPGAPLHTNFKLDRAGGFLALLDPGTNLVSVFHAYPSQFIDVSYGTDPEYSGASGYLSPPTPGAANAATFTGRAAAPQFSHTRGFYDTNFSLILESDTVEATIYYTRDGTPPSPSLGIAYSAPIGVTGTTVIRAGAFAPGLLPSEVRTHTFLFTRDIIRQSPNGAPPPGWPSSWGVNVVDYGMDPNVVNDARYRDSIEGDLRAMPSLSLVLELPDLFDPDSGIYANAARDGRDWERPTSLELIHGDGRDGFQENAGLRIRGGFSRGETNPKHSFRFLFREDYGAGRLQFRLFGPGGAGSFDKFDLRTAQDGSYAFLGDEDGTFLPDTFARDTLGAMGQPYTRGDFYHLYINGVYWGVYNTEERAEGSYASSYFGGAPEDYDVIKVDHDPHDVIAVEGDLEAWGRLWQAATNGFASNADYERVQGHHPDGSPNPAYEVLVDMDNLIDFMLLTIYVGNYDGPVFLDEYPNNFCALRNRRTREGFRFLTHDAELSLNDPYADRTETITVGDPAAGSAFSESNPQYLWQRLWANTEFRMRTADHVHRHFFNQGALSAPACIARYAARTNELFRGMVGESARWGDAQREPPIVRDHWVEAVSEVLAFYLPMRSDIVLEQLRNRGLYPTLEAPQFSPYGGAVPTGYALDMIQPNPSGTLWFTLDGSDPRVRGGAVSPTARPYAGSIAILATTWVRARVLSGSTWSALAEAVFYPPQDLRGLRVTEIMFNPPGLDGVDGDEFEFLELNNAGALTLDLTGLSFTEGIQYTFPNNTKLAPGAYLVLARNADRFGAKYPGVMVDGLYTGKLDNAGETLRLTTALSNLVLELTYEDALPGVLAADGFGFSLVDNQASGCAGHQAGCWRPSAQPGGSPGRDEPPSLLPPIQVTELLSRPVPPDLDALELYNPTTLEADLSGWFLTDDPGSPGKWRLPPGTVLPPDSYLVFDEVAFNAVQGGPDSFAFGLRGDGVFLFSADANANLTGYSHGFTFPAAAEGVSFGLHLTSTGEAHFTPQVAVTLGGANAGPRVGPVVISEIHYHPVPGDDAFIELHNVTSLPVPLFDAAHPADCWRLNGAGFVFPTNMVLPPHGYALITALDPAAYRSKHPVPEATLLWGPMAGRLQDDGERLELQRPETPDTNGLLWITVDSVAYSSAPPWPSGASGAGASLQRLNPMLYGDDPGNWFASGSTPGATNTFNQAPVISLVAPANGVVLLAPANVTVTAVASDADGFIQRVAFYNSGAMLGEATTSPYQCVWSNAPVGTHTLTAVARDNRLGVTESAAVLVTVRQPVLLNFPLVPAGASWRYYDLGQNPGADWTLLGFQDSQWSSGPAQLGYGDGDESSIVEFGQNDEDKHITTYFRHAFTNTAPVPFSALTLRVLRDDGVVVWLDGTEIFRDNMPGGPVTAGTFASSLLGPPEESEFVATNLPPNLLTPGAHVFAVEIHQGSPDSPDISFDLELNAVLGRPDPRLTLVAVGDQIDLRWPALAGPFRLEQSFDLTPPVVWLPLTNEIRSDGYWNRFLLTRSPSLQQCFFRLNRQ